MIRVHVDAAQKALTTLYSIVNILLPLYNAYFALSPKATEVNPQHDSLNFHKKIFCL